jgi:flavin-binding protein dodecin
MIRGRVEEPWVLQVGSLLHETCANEPSMSGATIAEITAASDTSFEDAIARGIKRAKKRLKDIRCARVQDQKVDVKKG